MRTGRRASTKKCAAAHGRRSPHRRDGDVSRSSVLCRRTADPELVSEALGVEPTDKLHSDVDIPIGSAGDNRRGQVVALNDSQSVASPAQSDANVGLRRESNFVSVNPHEQNHIAPTFPRTTDSERRRI